MPRLLKQSTVKIFRIGPFLDSTDGVMAETGLSIAQADIQISKAGGAFAQTSDGSPTTTHDADGWYQCPLTATDSATLGMLTVQIAMAGALPVWEHFMVVTANMFDSLVAGSDKLAVDTQELNGTALTGRDIGASVLVSPGSGAGQLDVANGVVKSNLAQILGTALTETGGYLAAGFKKFFNIVTPLLTVETTVQAAADAALVANHLDHIFKTNYDPASKPGVATALLNELVESDAGVSRYTANALELAPDTTASLTLHSDYNAAKTAAAPGAAMTLTGAYDAAKSAAAPGAAMALTGAYDAAKTAASETELDHVEKFAGTLYYVDGTSGNDSNDGSSPSSAFATIGKAITEAGVGDKIRVFGGVYTEVSLDLDSNGIWLVGEQGVRLTGNNATTCLVVSADDCYVENVRLESNLTEKGLSITGQRCRVKDCIALTCTTGFEVTATGHFSRFVDCRASACVTNGFLYYAASCLFRRCVSTSGSPATRGFYAAGDAAHRNTLVGCVSVNNPTASFEFVSGADDNMIDRCSDSEGCGAAVDNGADNTWRDFQDGTPAGGLSAQQTRDAMKLEPTGGAPAAGSVDAHLDTSVAVDAKVDSAMEADGPVHRFTTNALEMAPGGAGAGAVTITEATLDLDDVEALGKVETDLGVPIAGAIVNVYADADTDLATVLYMGITDGDGGFSIQVAPGAIYRIKPVFSGYTFDTERVST